MLNGSGDVNTTSLQGHFIVDENIAPERAVAMERSCRITDLRLEH